MYQFYNIPCREVSQLNDAAMFDSDANQDDASLSALQVEVGKLIGCKANIPSFKYSSDIIKIYD